MMRQLNFAFAMALTLTFLCTNACALDLVKFERELKSEGAIGEIHGVVADRELYVFTYRNPENFFDFKEISLIPVNEEIKSQLKGLTRHDRVKIKGQLLANHSPQPHAEISSLEVVTSYQQHPGTRDYEYQAIIPDDLQNQDQATFLVHAVHAQGKILVLEYKDAVIPVYVRDNKWTSSLARNDVIKMKYKIKRSPKSPTHMLLDESQENALEVMESVMQMHEKKADVQGALVMFPKSPQVKFNVFAVLQKLPQGLNRQYTLINFDDPEIFLKLREKLQKAWDEAGDSAWVNGRNKLISTRLQVRAKGLFNEVDPNQANVQIILKSVDDLEIIKL